DWSDNAAKQGKPEGETLTLRKQLQKEMGQLGFRGLLQQAEGSQGAARAWEGARKGLWEAEEYRAKVRPEYARRLRLLLTGPGAAQEVELVNHLPTFDARTNFLKMKEAEHNGEPLKAKVTYLKEIGLQRGDSVDLDGKLLKHYRDDLKHT